MPELEPGAPEAGWERQTIEKIALAAITEQRRARKWGIFFKSLLFIYLFALLFIGLGWFAKRDITPGKHTALVDLNGIISA
ncbi:MAG TPA: S49 family peptidase, partial [Burkholderiales bacterium]|nr:S49 family peptidase [Burkholderiales bacterium]